MTLHLHSPLLAATSTVNSNGNAAFLSLIHFQKTLNWMKPFFCKNLVTEHKTQL